ncbi:MAG: hypothetical protein QM235_08870 [Pseudomonadota bacterium]|nr:hypothetical protein [Pseudomonadota bacterium]
MEFNTDMAKSEGWEKRRIRGVEDSRGRVEKGRRLEGWRVGYTSTPLTFQPSTHLHCQTS